MIHMEYYLVVSTIMMFAGIYGFFTRRNTPVSYTHLRAHET